MEALFGSSCLPPWPPFCSPPLSTLSSSAFSSPPSRGVLTLTVGSRGGAALRRSRQALAPAAHAFVYPVRYAHVDLDRLPLPNHLSAADARRIASTSGRSRTTSPPPTRAVSHPPPAAPEPPLRRQRAPYRIHLWRCASPDDTKSVGYEQNPLSVYYCYDSAVQEQDGELKMCIAEVG